MNLRKTNQMSDSCMFLRASQDKQSDKGLGAMREIGLWAGAAYDRKKNLHSHSRSFQGGVSHLT